MGSFDGAEICELVGLFLLSELSGLGIDIGLYRDDGLAASSKSAREIENIKKKMCAIFKNYNLKITIEANKKRVEFLDVYFDLEKDEYGPFMKPNVAFIVRLQQVFDLHLCQSNKTAFNI